MHHRWDKNGVCQDCGALSGIVDPNALCPGRKNQPPKPNTAVLHSWVSLPPGGMDYECSTCKAQASYQDINSGHVPPCGASTPAPAPVLQSPIYHGSGGCYGCGTSLTGRHTTIKAGYAYCQSCALGSLAGIQTASPPLLASHSWQASPSQQVYHCINCGQLSPYAPTMPAGPCPGTKGVNAAVQGSQTAAGKMSTAQALQQLVFFAGASGYYDLPPIPDDVPLADDFCVDCGVELSDYMDAWYGDPEAYEAGQCVNCRHGRKHSNERMRYQQ